MSARDEAKVAVVLEPIRHESWQCPVCGGFFASRQLCLAGLDFVPPDPRPVGTKVRWRGREDPSWQGVVTESRVENAAAPHGHHHFRRVTIKHGDGSGSHLVVDRDGSPTLLEWEIVALPS